VKDRIDTLLDEQRSFPPLRRSHRAAHVKDDTRTAGPARTGRAIGRTGRVSSSGFRPWDKVLEWRPPHARWFLGGTLNASVNCLDRHVRDGRADKIALIWEGEPEPREVRKLTYRELHELVNRFANVLKNMGVQAGRSRRDLHGDGAGGGRRDAGVRAHRRSHTVVFGGFSAESLRDRINDCQAKVLVTGGRRLSSRQRGATQGQRRRRPPGHAQHPQRGGVEAYGPGSVPASRPGPLVARPDGEGRTPVRARAHGRRGSAVHPLHLRDDGKPKGILHTTGGYLTHVYATTSGCST